jgi:hypothetical protein
MDKTVKQAMYKLDLVHWSLRAMRDCPHEITSFDVEALEVGLEDGLSMLWEASEGPGENRIEHGEAAYQPPEFR